MITMEGEQEVTGLLRVTVWGTLLTVSWQEVRGTCTVPHLPPHLLAHLLLLLAAQLLLHLSAPAGTRTSPLTCTE